MQDYDSYFISNLIKLGLRTAHPIKPTRQPESGIKLRVNKVRISYFKDAAGTMQPYLDDAESIPRPSFW
jgi:hypothetical protein